MSDNWEVMRGYQSRMDEATLDAYVHELLRWNKAIRLIGPQDRGGAIKQVIDSMLPFFHAPPTFPLLDIGSGAGLPAIPLAIAHGSEKVVCLEPSTKRVSFLRHASRFLSLGNLLVIPFKAEEAVKEHPELLNLFATVTARAVADVSTLLGWAEPYLAQGGRVILGRGSDKIECSRGWLLESHAGYRAQDGFGERSVAVFVRE